MRIAKCKLQIADWGEEKKVSRGGWEADIAG